MVSLRPSVTIHNSMGKLKLIAFAITTLTLLCLVATVVAQTKDSSKISNASTGSQGDEAFAGYERVTAGITPPKATKSPDPPYPELPADTEPRGVVVMLIGVDTRGHVGPVHVVRSSASAFEKIAVDTVKTWRFKPAKKDGKPVPVEITVEMSFAR